MSPRGLSGKYHLKDQPAFIVHLTRGFCGRRRQIERLLVVIIVAGVRRFGPHQSGKLFTIQ
jgi:hypothetical protein